MSATEKMLALAGLARVAYSQWRLQKLLSSLITVTILVFITSIMVCVMLIGGFYAAYFALLHYGAEPYTAVLIVAMLCALVTILFAIFTLKYLRRLHALPRTLVGHTVSERAGEIIDAFLDGLNDDATRR